MPETLPTFAMVHPTAGECLCDERQVDEFIRDGWKRKDSAPAVVAVEVASPVVDGQ